MEIYRWVDVHEISIFLFLCQPIVLLCIGHIIIYLLDYYNERTGSGLNEAAD